MQGIGAILFAALAVVAQPVLWVVVVCSASSIVATSLHLHRFRRALHAVEAELAHAADAERERRV